MRADKTIGMAMVLLMAGALATLWQAPHVAAAGQQTASQNQQAEKPKVEKQTITVRKSTGGKPMVVTVEGEPGQDPKVMTHMIQGEPMIAALGGGPRLGIEIRDLGKEDLAKFKLSSQQGVAVEQVTKDSAAEKAGVKAGDVVVQFDGENVRSAAQLTRLVRETVAGRTVKMGVMRDGKRIDLDVAPAEAENEFAQQLLRERRTPAPGGTFTWEERVPAPGQPIPPMQPIPPGGAPRWQQRTPMPVPEGDILQWHGEGNWPGNFLVHGRPEPPRRERAGADTGTGRLLRREGRPAREQRPGRHAGGQGRHQGRRRDWHRQRQGGGTTPDELIKELADKDGEVTIGVTRDKKALSLKATLEPRKAPARRTVVVGRPA